MARRLLLLHVHPNDPAWMASPRRCAGQFVLRGRIERRAEIVKANPISSDTQLAPASLDRYQAPRLLLRSASREPMTRSPPSTSAHRARAKSGRCPTGVPPRAPRRHAALVNGQFVVPADGSPAWSRLLTFGSTSRGRIGVQEVVGIRAADGAARLPACA